MTEVGFWNDDSGLLVVEHLVMKSSTHFPLRARTAVAFALSAAVVAWAAPAAQAKLQQVDLYTAYLELKVDNQAFLKEDGWSHVRTDTQLNGTIHARVDGLKFVDGVPQQTTVPFASSNATDLTLSQHAKYTSPEGSEEGDCDEASSDGVPLVPGEISTTIGATGADGGREIAIEVRSPEQVWIQKRCTGYLKYEVADPLLKEPVTLARSFSITDVGGDLDLQSNGTLPCPNFIRIFDCKPLYSIAVELQHTDRYLQGEPDAPLPVPTMPPPPGENATDAEHEAFNLALMVRMAREDRYGQAVVRCGRPCEGHVSAFAIALSKQGTPKSRPRKLATTTFRSDAHGKASPTLRLNAAQRRLVRQRGTIRFQAEGVPINGGTPVRQTLDVRARRH